MIGSAAQAESGLWPPSPFMGSSPSSMDGDPSPLHESFEDLYGRDLDAFRSFFRSELPPLGQVSSHSLLRFPVCDSRASLLFVVEHLRERINEGSLRDLEERFNASLDEEKEHPLQNLQHIVLRDGNTGLGWHKALEQVRALGKGSYGTVDEMRAVEERYAPVQMGVCIEKIDSRVGSLFEEFSPAVERDEYTLAMKSAPLSLESRPGDDPAQVIPRLGEVVEAGISFSLSQLQLPGFPLFFGSGLAWQEGPFRPELL